VNARTAFAVKLQARGAIPPSDLGYRGFQVLRFIEERFVQTGIGPSLDEIRDELGFCDKAGAKRAVDVLERRGLVRRARIAGRGQRRIRLA
jgi:SOS-response transcriptional repressor LexA